MRATAKVSGSFDNTEKFLKRMQNREYLRVLDKYGALGVAALSQATPVETGKSAESWYYEIVNRAGYYSIRWRNSDTVGDGVYPVVLLLQYGHGTRNGGYVQGRDFINPAIQPIFDQMVNDFWKEVTRK